MEFWLAFSSAIRRRAKYCAVSVLLALVFSSSVNSAEPLPRDESGGVDSVVPFSDYHQRLWDTRNHLPQVSAISIAEDPRGYIWVATEGGLARFDGANFEVFDGSVSPLFADPLLRKVFVAPDGTVWVGSTDRLITISVDNTIREITVEGKPAGRIEDIVWFNGAIYAGGDAFYRIEMTASEAEIFSGEAVEQLDASRVTSMTVLSNRLWVATEHRLFALSAEEGKPEQEVDLTSLGNKVHVTRMTQYDGTLILGTNSGLMQLDEQLRVSPYPINSASISDAVELTFADSYGNLWIAGNQRLLQVVKGRLIEEVTDIDGKTAPWFVTGFEDRKGNLWFGSRTHGIQRLRYDGTRRLGKAAGLEESYVWTFTPGRSGMLVGTNQGLYLYANERFTPMLTDDRLPDKAVYALFTDSKAHYWIGTRSGLIVVDDSMAVIQTFPELDSFQINSIAEGEDGTVWIATLGGLYRWTHNTLEAMTDAFNLGTVNIRYVYMDEEQTLWIGTARGLFQYKSGNAQRYAGDKLLASTSVSYIGQLSDGRLLIGTFQSGFAVQNPDGWRWMTPEQLPAAGVMFVAEHNESLIFSSLRGVYQMIKQSLTSDGRPDVRLIIDDYGQEADSDGIRCCNGAGSGRGMVVGDYLYLPTLNNVARLDLNHALASADLQNTVIESLKTRNKKYFSGQPRLPEGVRNVQFRYTSPVFYRNSALTFRYRLNGYDTEWTEVGGRREAFYTNLPHGNYTFEVQSRLREQNPWSEGDTFHFSITPFWYERPWMRFIFVLAGMLVFWGFFYLRTIRLQRAKQHLEDMVQSRTRELDKANQQLADANVQLKKASLTDALTGLCNRRYHDNNISMILQRAEKQQGVYAVLLDIDNFKLLNDEYGHAIGDEVLTTFSQVLRSQTGYNDHLIRWGGEEFLIILSGKISPADFITDLMAALKEAEWPAPIARTQPPTCSVGVCYHPPHSQGDWEWKHTLVLADKAMYLVKGHGKNGWLMMMPEEGERSALADSVIHLHPEVLFQQKHLIMCGSPHVMDKLKKRCPRVGETCD